LTPIDIIILLFIFVAFGLSVLLVFYAHHSGGLKDRSNADRVQRIESLILLTAGLFYVAYVLSRISPLGQSALLLWSMGLLIPIYDTIWVGRTVRKVHREPWGKIFFHTPGSVWHWAGRSLLAVCIIFVSSFDVFQYSLGDSSQNSFFGLVIWTLCLGSLVFSAREKAHSPSVVQTKEKQENITSLEDDILVVKAYGDFINRILKNVKPPSKVIWDTVADFFEHNPILFQGCALGPERHINFESVAKNMNRIEETKRIRHICLMFSVLCARILDLHSAMTSPEYSEAILVESFHATQESYQRSPLLSEILRTLPEGVLEDEKLVSLSKEELETKVRERTRDLARSESRYREAYETLKDTQTQLIQSGKLASIGELSAGVAHELNQPLMVIRLNAQLVKRLVGEEKLSFEKIDEIIEPIERNTKRMMTIIDHLRTFSRQSKPGFSPVDIHKVLNECFLMIGEQLRVRNIQVTKDFAPDMPKALGDANQLEQVFLNLITNARDAILQSRAAGFPKDEGEIKISTRIPRNHEGVVDVMIRDSGIGISAADLERIFDPFFTTKEIGKGTGLGLSISYGIVKEHGGTIDVAETGPGGTVFRVCLPVR